MRTLDFWMLKHPRLAAILFCALLLGLEVGVYFLLDRDFVLWLAMILTVLLVLVVVYSASARIVNRAVKIFNNECDPEPLLNDSEQILSFLKKKNRMLFITMLNKSVALHDLGFAEEAVALLKGMNTDEFTGLIPTDKFVYYNNLSAYENTLKNNEAADEAFRQQSELFEGLKDSKVKDSLVSSVNIALASYRHRRGEYSAALEALKHVSSANKNAAVKISFLHAQILRDSGELEGARACLRYVLENGGKLAIRDEAKGMLDDIA